MKLDLLKGSLKNSFIVLLLIFIISTILGSPEGGLYALIILFIPVSLISVASMFLLALLYTKVDITKRIQRLVFGFLFSVMGYLIYLLGCVLIFQEFLLAIRDTWFIMMLITVIIALNSVTIPFRS